MQWLSGESVTRCFTTTSSTGEVDADSLPTGVLVIDGVDNGASVTVTKKSTGNYKAQVTLPAVTDGSVLEIRISATVAGISEQLYLEAGQGSLARLPASPASTTNITAGTITTATNLTNAPTAGDLTAAMKASVTAAVPTAAANATATAAQITTDHGSGSYIRNTEPLDASGTRTAVGLATADLDTQLSNLTTAISSVDGNAQAAANHSGATQVVTDKLATALELDGSVYRFTTNALEQAPTGGGSAPTAAENAAAVWDEALSGHATAGSAGAGLSAAQSAGDPWSTALPGSYAAGTAGDILGNRLPSDVAAALAGLDIDVQSAWDGGILEIFQGAEYSVALGNHVDWAASDLPSLSGGLARFHILNARGVLVVDASLSIINAGASNQAIRFTLPATESIKVKAPDGHVGNVLYKTSGATTYAPWLKFGVVAKRL